MSSKYKNNIGYDKRCYIGVTPNTTDGYNERDEKIDFNIALKKSASADIDNLVVDIFDFFTFVKKKRIVSYLLKT